MSNTALLIIDAQNEMYDEANPVHQSEKMLRNLKSLIEKARAADVPVIYVQHNDAALVEGTDFWQIHPSIAPEPDELIVQKKTPDSFYGTRLLEELKNRGIQNLVLAGNQTEYCIDATTRSASQHGFNVTLVKDAHGTWDSEDRKASQIIDHYNEQLRDFAALQETGEIEFRE